MFSFSSFFGCWVASSCAQELLLDLHLMITPGRFKYGVLEIESRLTMYKTSALTLHYLCDPRRHTFLKTYEGPKL